MLMTQTDLRPNSILVLSKAYYPSRRGPSGLSRDEPATMLRRRYRRILLVPRNCKEAQATPPNIQLLKRPTRIFNQKSDINRRTPTVIEPHLLLTDGFNSYHVGLQG